MGGSSLSADEWRHRGDQYLEMARNQLHSVAPEIVYRHLFDALEFHLKAAIMSASRMNRWPERRERGDLYVHDLRKLSMVAEVIGNFEKMRNDLPGLYRSWCIVRDMEPRMSYYRGDLSRWLLEQLIECAVSASDGVIPWLRSL